MSIVPVSGELTPQIFILSAIVMPPLITRQRLCLQAAICGFGGVFVSPRLPPGHCTDEPLQEEMEQPLVHPLELQKHPGCLHTDLKHHC